MAYISVRPETAVGRFATRALAPLMRFLLGAPQERPQITHFWNNRRLDPKCLQRFYVPGMTPPRCDPNAIRRRGWWDVRFHMPRYGGWKKYVVVALQPKLAQQGHWFIGWTDHCTTAGVSLVPITERKVRVLLGPDDVSFFGLDAEGYQIKVAIFGSGTIGDGGPYAQLPLY